MKVKLKSGETWIQEPLERNGFVLTNPQSAGIHHIWSKDGKQYRFDGWEKDETGLTAKNPKYIVMLPVTRSQANA